MMVVSQKTVHKLYKGIKRSMAEHIARTNNVTWEVNTLAEAEPQLPPIRWYKADHNETLFTNYPESPHAVGNPPDRVGASLPGE